MSHPLEYEQKRVSSAATHVLFCGGFHSSMRGTKATHLQQLCKARGLSYTRFDYRGHGESPGELDHLHLGDWLDDTRQVLERCEERVIIIGSSMGAWLAVLATQRCPERVDAMLLLAAAPDFITELLWQSLSTDERERVSRGDIVRRQNHYDDALWPLHRDLFESGKHLSVLDSDVLADIRCPVRLLHGTADRDVPWRQSLRLMEKLTSADASLLLLQGADHRLSDERSLGALENSLDELMHRVQSARRQNPGNC